MVDSGSGDDDLVIFVEASDKFDRFEPWIAEVGERE